MKQFEIQVGVAWNSTANIAKAIESVLHQHGLERTMKGTLRSFPGCVHWHFKKPRATGTLEATLWPSERRVWLSVQSGRTADWIEKSLKQICGDLERALRKDR